MESTTPAPEPTSVGTRLTFRDTRFTSRTLILPGDRELSVVRSQVVIDASDKVAAAYLGKHPDMQKE